MRILLDQNLSPIPMVADVVPGLETVYDHGLIEATDRAIFLWARHSEFSALISTDRDLVALAQELGPPPKVIRIERCDFRSKLIAQLIRREALRIRDFLVSERAILPLKL